MTTTEAQAGEQDGATGLYMADAVIWAQEFKATQIKLGQVPLDEGWMVAWFASAIMAGYDTANNRHTSAMTDAYERGRQEQREVDAKLCHDMAIKEGFSNITNTDDEQTLRRASAWMMDQCSAAIRAQAGQTDVKALNIDELVNRFLAWPLPNSVCSDLCATKQGYPGRSGTTLLSATETRQMLEYVLAKDHAGRVT